MTLGSSMQSPSMGVLPYRKEEALSLQAPEPLGSPCSYRSDAGPRAQTPVSPGGTLPSPVQSGPQENPITSRSGETGEFCGTRHTSAK